MVKCALTAFAVQLIRGYQFTFSYFLGGNCRFHPSCSEFAVQAIESHGLVRGFMMASRRLLKCHPFGPFGFDPVPPKSEESHVS